jgi:hypothetical protein
MRHYSKKKRRHTKSTTKNKVESKKPRTIKKAYARNNTSHMRPKKSFHVPHKLARNKRPSKKSSFKKRTSAGLKVMWSPKVKQIERTSKTLKKKRHNPQISHIYIKRNHDKTIKNSGILYAQYKNKTQLNPIVLFKLYDDETKFEVHTTINLVKKSITNVKFKNKSTTQLFKQSTNGDQRIRLLMKFGDIVWKHGRTNVYRKSNTKGFNVNWLKNMYESHYSTDGQ